MKENLVVPDEIISSKIYYIRGHKVMLDYDLAELYEVETKRLKRQVRRNLERFADEDFMFELTNDEYKLLRSHFGTLKQGQHFKCTPVAFTKLWTSILSSFLNSPAAIQVNRRIMRIFIQIRHALAIQQM